MVGKVVWYNYFGQQLGHSYEGKHTFTKQPGNSTPAHFPNRHENIRPHETGSQMSIAAVLRIAPNWKQPKCSTGEWLNKLWHIQTMEYSSGTKQHELLIHTAAWVNHKSMPLIKEVWHKRIQGVLPFLCYSKRKWIYKQNESTMRADQWLNGARALGGMRDYTEVMEKFCILSVVVITQVFTFIKTHQTMHLLWVCLVVNKLNLTMVI